MTVFIVMAWLGVAGVLLIKPSCIISKVLNIMHGIFT